MTPLRKPRDPMLTLVASALCKGVISGGRIEDTGRGRKVIRVTLFGILDKPGIYVPPMEARLLYESACKQGDPFLYINQDMMIQHARKVINYIRNRECTVRVCHYYTTKYGGDGRNWWTREVVEVR